MSVETRSPAGIDESILDTLRTMAADPDRLAPEATLAEVEIDSLDLVELVQLVEEAYGVELPQKALDGVLTVGDVIDRLTGHVAAAEAVR